MKERPILFSAPMVCAILDGRKTQTRRVVMPALSWREWVERRDSGDFWRCADGEPTCYSGVWETNEYAQQHPIACPYGQPGDRLWVREAWAYHPDFPESTRRAIYRADEGVENDVPRWLPSIHMPRWASRILLEITDVRVDRLNDISEDDAVAEGCETVCMTPTGEDNGSAIYGPDGYAALWDAINGSGSWGANPWVWVVEFKQIGGAA